MPQQDIGKSIFLGEKLLEIDKNLSVEPKSREKILFPELEKD